jgi:hypothetical protein
MKLLFIYFFCLINFNVVAQNNISGFVESVPDHSPAFARITFTNSSDTNFRYIAYTDSATGNYSLMVPNGFYERTVEVQGHFLFLDILQINSTQTMDFQIIKDLGNTSTYHPNILNVFKTLTGTLDEWSLTNLNRWNDSNVPIKHHIIDTPPDYLPILNSALLDIATKSNGMAQLVESPVNVDTGITTKHLPRQVSPCPGATACTNYDLILSDGSPGHVSIYINLPVQPISQLGPSYRRELLRAMPLFDLTLDPSFVMCFNGTSAQELHPDEGKVLQIMFALKHNTDMRPHKEIVVNYTIPVELISFNYSLTGNNINLEWRTATETNNQGFELQRKQVLSQQLSIGNKDWEVLGFINGAGTSTEKHFYSYEDKNIISGNYHYRLKQIDYDGTSTYSQVLIVNINQPEEFSLKQNFPNPFNPSTKISWQSPVAGHQSLRVYDVLGKEVAILVDEFSNAGSYEIDFDASNLSSGVYFYQLKSVDFLQTKKMILIK